MGAARATWRLLGEVAVEIDGRAVGFKGQRHRAVVAYLLLDVARVVTVDRLIDAIWGERPPKTARNTLQRYIADIRQTLGPVSPQLVTVAGGYRLDAGPDDIDLARFEQAIEQANALPSTFEGPRSSASLLVQVTEARDAWRSVVDFSMGRPLSGIGDTNYGDGVRSRIEEHRNQAIEHLVAHELELGRHGSVMNLIEDFAERHPTRDRAWELMMLTRYRSGRQADALDAYQTLRRRLLADLGVDPAPSVQALHRSILDHSVPPAAHVATSPAAATATSSSDHPGVGSPARLPLPAHLVVGDGLSLVGRRSEISGIDTALSSDNDRASVFFVGGEPGMGKSRCAAEVAERAHARGVNVVYGRCTAGLNIDYQPWRAALSQILSGAPSELVLRHRRRFGDVLATFSGTEPPNESPSTVSVDSATDSEAGVLVASVDVDSVFRATVTLLGDVASTSSLLVVLDDLQWCDRATLRLLRYVVENSVAPVVVLGLYRNDEVDSNHPLTQHIAAAPSDTRMTTVELVGLDEAGTRDLIAAAGGLDAALLDDSIVTSLHAMTRGNPYFVIEAVRALHDAAGGGSLTRATDLVVPASVRRLLVQRVERLGDDVARTLRLASAFGREFDLEVLADALRLDEFDVLDHIEVAIAARLIDDAPEGRDRFAFAHDLVHQSLAADQSESRRCRAHSAIGDAMEKVYASRLDAHVEEIAMQLVAAKNASDAARTFAYCRRAGVAAAARFAPDDSIRWFERSLDIIDRAPIADLALKAEVLVQLGKSKRLAAVEGQREALIEAGRLAIASGNHRALVESVTQNWRAVNGAGWTLDQERIDMARAALEAVGGDDSIERAHVLAALGLAMWEVEHSAEARDVYEELVALAQRLGDPLTSVIALDVTLTARNYRPARAQMRSFAAELRALCATVPLDPVQFVSAASSLATTALQLADRELLEHAIGAIDHEAERTGIPAAVNASNRAKALRSWIEGDVVGYEAAVTESFEYSSRFEGSDVATLVFRGQMFFAIWAHGREADLLDVDALVPGRPATRPLYRVIQALAHIAAGKPDGANAILSAELDAGFWPNDNHWTMQSTTMWADPAVQLGRRDVCEVVIDNLAPSTGSIAGQFMSPFEPVDTALGRMLVVVDRFAEAEEHFARADAIVDEFDAAWMRARVDLGRLELALARRGPGDDHIAQAVSERLRSTSTARGYGSIIRRLDVLAALVA